MYDRSWHFSSHLMVWGLAFLISLFSHIPCLISLGSLSNNFIFCQSIVWLHNPTMAYMVHECRMVQLHLQLTHSFSLQCTLHTIADLHPSCAPSLSLHISYQSHQRTLLGSPYIVYCILHKLYLWVGVGGFCCPLGGPIACGFITVSTPSALMDHVGSCNQTIDWEKMTLPLKELDHIQMWYIRSHRDYQQGGLSCHQLG